MYILIYFILEILENDIIRNRYFSTILIATITTYMEISMHSGNVYSGDV